ncbi:hypothetical protein HJFPF1_01751 [Paramyrothecium foliicola]|nr:hypothetical protein HJFPF1_01751 [Paramyrothecium foliicola]
MSSSTTSPPPYSTTSTSVAPTSTKVQEDNDGFAFLARFDTKFIIDDSGSMAGSLWKEVNTALQAIVEICVKYDEDGIDLHFLNHTFDYQNVQCADRIMDIFNSINPSGLTPTGARLFEILDPYIQELGNKGSSVKPVNVIIITDGRPTDDPEGTILQLAARLDKQGAPSHQVGIQFFQIGNDRKATEALEYLDDGLAKQGVRDMVDTVPWDGRRASLSSEYILKIVLGAVNRRLDREV